MAEETPLFLQYQSIKNDHSGEVLFFRVGDFYEMFNDDAVEVSRLLNLTLTHRGENPMCGVPYHASKIYIARLLRLGKKVAIAEQVGDVGNGKGLAERKVVEIITPGTALESEYLESSVNNYLASFSILGKKLGLAFLDVTTGDFRATSFDLNFINENLSKELGRYNPKEILIPDSLKNNQEIQKTLSLFSNVSVSWYPSWNFNTDLAFQKLIKQFGTTNLRSFSLLEDSAELAPAGFLLDYVEKTTGLLSKHIRSINVYQDCEYVIIDDSSRRNLEILQNLRDNSSNFTLFDCVNSCKTAMGSRTLRTWLMFPLTDVNKIKERQNHVEFFYQDRNLFKKVREYLSGILDIERLSVRIAMDRAHGKDLQALKNSLILWKKVSDEITVKGFSLQEVQTASSIIDLIDSAILDDPATSLTEGRLIKQGWSEELDNWTHIQNDFTKILDQYLEEEKENTGIQNLRIKNNGNMGYFIEVTKGKLDKVPSHFIMRRALVNADRYTTERLQELESKLYEASTKIIELERNLFLEVRNNIKNHIDYLLQLSFDVAYCDVTCSFADAAIKNDWVKPLVDNSFVFDIEDGRHPVVEKNIPKGEFVPNSLSIKGEENFTESFALITGPNMAGKSTFLRQNALITLLAQVGSFVPAKKARIGLVDKIFCRVGASDNLAKGESTFLVEMTETAHILRSATEKSFVIMDEVGRGTSTEDGLSIAWAVSEYLLNRLKCKTLFATHYHELTRLEHESIKMLCMAVNESGDNIVFLRKVVDGASANSYGIHVASLAGIPKVVIDRANSILNKIQDDAAKKPILVQENQSELIEDSVSVEKILENQQKSLTGSLFSDEELILDEILSLDLDNTTPIHALQILARWKKTLKG